MSDSANNPTVAAVIRSADAVWRLLGRLRSRMRRYYAFSGILLLVSAAVAVYWLTTVIDQGWFALQRLELPVGLRAIVLVLMIACGMWLAFQHLLWPLLRRTRDEELALLIERRYPEFQDRLITTVEARREPSPKSDLAVHMLSRTVAEANRVAAGVSVDGVFNPRPLQTRMWAAGFCLLTMVASAVASPGSLHQWWNAFVLCEPTYHQRKTHLDFSVIAPPENRRVQFLATAVGPSYRHPIGADLELEITVPEQHPHTKAACVVPDRVRVDVIRFDGSRSRTYLTPTSGRTFRFILTRLQESVKIEVLGGDYRTPMPLRVQAVEPPSLDDIEAMCRYPDYTGLNEIRDPLVPVLSREVALPIGTVFDLKATANKSLQSARISTDAYDVEGDQKTCRVTARENYHVAVQPDGPLIDSDGRTLRASFVLTLAGGSDRQTPEPEGSAAVRAAENLKEKSALPVPPNSTLKFYLHDVDDIQSASPEILRFRGIADAPPVIAVRKHGVGNAITRRAIIPVRGVIRDDYGVMNALYRFTVDDETQWRPRPFRNGFRPMLEYDLEAAGGPGSEYFRVEELELSEGQTLSLTVYAVDGCTIPEPNETQAEPMVFRIVSPEELLSLLYTRELNQRTRFEEVIAQLTALQENLVFHREIALRVDAAENDASPEDRQGLTNCARECGDGLRRQSNELRSIIESFEEIRAELIHNSIPPKQLADDMQANIIKPLLDVRADNLVNADLTISRFRVAVTTGQPSAALVEQAIQDLAGTIARLKSILENVRDMAEFHELYQEGKYIYEEILKLWEETRELQKKRAIERLRLLQ